MVSQMIIAALALGASTALASHIIQVNNNCGQPFKMQFLTGQQEVTSAGTYTYDGDIRAQAYVGSSCGNGGQGCTTGQFTLSTGDITYAAIVAESFSVPLTVTLDNGQSKTCQYPGCPDAYTDPSQSFGKDAMEKNPNSGVTLQFC